MVSRPAASAMPGNLLEMPILGPDLTKTEILGTGPEIYVLISPSGELDTC